MVVDAAEAAEEAAEGEPQEELEAAGGARRRRERAGRVHPCQQCDGRGAAARTAAARRDAGLGWHARRNAWLSCWAWSSLPPRWRA